MIINSQLTYGSNLRLTPEKTNDNVIKNEPMFWRSDITFATANGGPLTIEFINRLPDKWYYDKSLIIDSRSHMLMSGFWPCIPGWHHDDVPREREDGQPNYINPSYCANHCMALVNGDIAPTEFATGIESFPEVPIGKKFYKEWNPIVEKKIQEGTLIKQSVPDRTLLFFDFHTWHQGTQAVKSGWRWFIRATINTKLVKQNEIRKQVQVYMNDPSESW